MFGEWTGEIDASFARAVCDRLDEIAALGAERRAALQEEPWATVAPIEQKLAEAVEKLLGIDDDAKSVAGEARRAADGGGDARRAYASALVLGCASNVDAIQAAVSALASPRAELRSAACEALTLGRNPALGPALTQLTDTAGAAVCAAALLVLRFRRQATFAPSALFLGHPDDRVAAAAARCLGTLPERTAAAALLRRVLMDDPADVLAVAATESLLTLGDSAGLAFVRGELKPRARPHSSWTTRASPTCASWRSRATGATSSCSSGRSNRARATRRPWVGSVTPTWLSGWSARSRRPTALGGPARADAPPPRTRRRPSRSLLRWR